MVKQTPLVKHRGKWMLPAERDRLIAAEAPKKSASAPTPTPQAVADPKPTASQPAPDSKAALAAAVAEYCAVNGAAQLAAGLIRDGATMEAVRHRVDGIGQIRGAFAEARKINAGIPATLEHSLIEVFQAGIITVPDARKALLDWLYDHQSPEISTAIASDQPGQPAAHNHGWAESFKKAKGGK